MPGERVVQVIDEQLLQYGSDVDSKVGGVERNLPFAILILAQTGDFVAMAPRTTVLELSFKSIGRIENLNGFVNVVKLGLDNNLIDRIINLESLTKLRWLDLSFNRIERIEGLSSLTDLRDLSLFNNKISVIQGLEGCSRLQCLSIGNNNIKSLEEIIKLRQLKELRMLTLAGNPVADSGEYRYTALAYLRDLMYFDYALVDPAEVAKACDAFYEYLEELKESEKLIEDRAAAEGKELARRRHLEEAGILFADILFDDMFRNDNEVEKLKILPHIKDLVESFRSDLKEDSERFIRDASEIYEARRTEVSKFETALKQMRAKDDDVSASLVEHFSNSLKAELNHIGDSDLNSRTTTVERLVNELENVCDELMSIEIRQVEKFEAMLDEFDNKLHDLKTRSLDLQQNFFRVTEDSEEKFTSKVKENITDLIDKNSRDELSEGFLEDEALALVLDKDVCLGYVTTSHEMHVGKILKREEEARTAETKAFRDEIDRLEREEKERNRDRVLQILDFGREKKSLLDSRLLTEDDEGFEEDL